MSSARPAEQSDVEVLLGVAEREHHRRVGRRLRTFWASAWRRRGCPRRPTRTRSERGAGRHPAGPWTARRRAPARGTGGSAWRRRSWCPWPQIGGDRGARPPTAVIGHGHGRVTTPGLDAWRGVSGACCRPASRRGHRSGRRGRPPRPIRRSRRAGHRAGPPGRRCRPRLSPPSGTFPFGVSMLMICGRNIASSGSSWPMSSPEPADSRWTVSGPSACWIWSGSTGCWDRRHPRVDLVAQPAVAQLGHEPVETAPPADRALQAGQRRRIALLGGARTALQATRSDRPRPVVLSDPPGCVPGGGYALHGCRLPRSAGEVEVDRRDRDPAVDDRVEVGAGTGEPGRRRAADPEVGDAARVEPLDELVLVDALAEAGDLEAVELLERRPPAR